MKKELERIIPIIKKRYDDGLIHQSTGDYERGKRCCIGAHFSDLFNSALPSYHYGIKDFSKKLGLKEYQTEYMLIQAGSHKQPFGIENWKTPPHTVLERMAQMKVPTDEQVIKYCLLREHEYFGDLSFSIGVFCKDFISSTDDTKILKRFSRTRFSYLIRDLAKTRLATIREKQAELRNKYKSTLVRERVV